MYIILKSFDTLFPIVELIYGTIFPAHTEKVVTFKTTFRAITVVTHKKTRVPWAMCLLAFQAVLSMRKLALAFDSLNHNLELRSSSFTLGRARTSSVLPHLITTLASPSSITFGRVQASLALPSLNHDLASIDDINALGELRG